MYGICFFLRSIPSQHFSLRYPCAERHRKDQVTANAPRQSHYVKPHVFILIFYLTHTRRTLYESKGLEFDDVSPVFLFFSQFPLLPIKSRSCYTISSRIPRQNRANGGWCSIGPRIGAVT